MAFSLNEIEATCKRAARGAGLPWGLAEEAGKAARWLTARGLPGAEELAEVLARNDGKSYGDLAPVSADGVWRAPAGRLCPIVTGAALCDRAAEIAAGTEIELGAVTRLLGDAARNITMSSTKSSIGHLLGAAGAVEAIFCVLALRDQVAPATLKLENPSVDTAVDLAPKAPRERPISVALSNSFGFGGTNASLVIGKPASV